MMIQAWIACRVSISECVCVCATCFFLLFLNLDWGKRKERRKKKRREGDNNKAWLWRSIFHIRWCGAVGRQCEFMGRSSIFSLSSHRPIYYYFLSDVFCLINCWSFIFYFLGGGGNPYWFWLNSFSSRESLSWGIFKLIVSSKWKGTRQETRSIVVNVRIESKTKGEAE